MRPSLAFRPPTSGKKLYFVKGGISLEGTYMLTTQIVKTPNKSPAKSAPQVQPAVEPKRTKEEVLDAIALDSFEQPKKYLENSVAPKGE